MLPLFLDVLLQLCHRRNFVYVGPIIIIIPHSLSTLCEIETC